MRPRLILGIESSCDETSAAVVANGREVLSNVVASQLVHAGYGGVVPELASREHLRNIVPIVREAMQQAGVASYQDLSAVAVTEGPGLAGALLVGISFAKALAFGAGLPLIAVNHLEGHIQAVLLQAEEQFADASPLLAAVISGGHSHLYVATRAPGGLWSYRNVGRTLDDAAGEAYDKVAKLLGLPYPGGPWMDALAPFGDPRAVPFRFAQIKTKRRRGGDPAIKRAAAFSSEVPFNVAGRRFDFSFSGIKTAVRRYTEIHGMREGIAQREANLRAAELHLAKPGDKAVVAEALRFFDAKTLNLIASFQHSVTGYLTQMAVAAAEHFAARSLAVSGGVAANRDLRAKFTAAAAKHNLLIAFPTFALSTDNAAMIAAAAWPKLLNKRFAPDTLEAAPSLRLG